jgi:hypothetical protein
MSIETEPTAPLLPNRQCIAAATLFGRASLAKLREANEPGLKNSPEGAVKLDMALIYSDLMAEMTKLAGELASPAPVAAAPETGGEHV